jgi:hypothetical protein
MGVHIVTVALLYLWLKHITDKIGRQEAAVPTVNLTEGYIELDLSALGNGIYFLIFDTSTGKTITKKLVVRH